MDVAKVGDSPPRRYFSFTAHSEAALGALGNALRNLTVGASTRSQTHPSPSPSRWCSWNLKFICSSLSNSLTSSFHPLCPTKPPSKMTTTPSFRGGANPTIKRERSRSPRRRSRSPRRTRRSYSRSRSRSREEYRRRSRSPMSGAAGAAGGYSGSGYGRGGAPQARTFEERAAAKEQMMQSLRDSSQQDRRVYVGNLSYDVKWHHLKDFMRQGEHVPDQASEVMG